MTGGARADRRRSPAVIILVGFRGTPVQELLLLGTAMAISAIPPRCTGLRFGVLPSMGSNQLAEAKAVVKNLTDVETLGATSAINTDKTGTLTMNEMMVLHVVRRWDLVPCGR